MSSSTNSSRSSCTLAEGCAPCSPLSFGLTPEPPVGKRYGHRYQIAAPDGHDLVIQGIKKKFGERLPYGSFGMIKGAEGPRGEDWVRKISWLNPPNESSRKHLSRRAAGDNAIKAHEKLKGKEGIVPYHGHKRYLNKVGKIKEVVFMDRADCNLNSQLKKVEREPFNQATQFSLASQLLKALALSLEGAAHGDLKPENILLKFGKEGITLWLCDFDFYCEKPGAWNKGTVPYMAPEVLLEGQCRDVRKLDVRAAGMILFDIFTNSFDYPRKTAPCAFPWLLEEGSDDAAINRIQQAVREFTAPKIKALLQKRVPNPRLQELLFGMLDPDDKTRWTIRRAYYYLKIYMLGMFSNQAPVHRRSRLPSI